MRAILSRPVPEFDITSAGFRDAARDLGEVAALLSGGLRPDPDTVARLGLSLRVVQGFLLAEADEQEGREAILSADLLNARTATSAPLLPQGSRVVDRFWPQPPCRAEVP